MKMLFHLYKWLFSSDSDMPKRMVFKKDFESRTPSSGEQKEEFRVVQKYGEEPGSKVANYYDKKTGKIHHAVYYDPEGEKVKTEYFDKRGNVKRAVDVYDFSNEKATAVLPEEPGGIADKIKQAGNDFLEVASDVGDEISNELTGKKPSLRNLGLSGDEITKGKKAVGRFFRGMNEEGMKELKENLKKAPGNMGSILIAGWNIDGVLPQHRTQMVQLFLGEKDDNLFKTDSLKAFERFIEDKTKADKINNVERAENVNDKERLKELKNDLNNVKNDIIRFAYKVAEGFDIKEAMPTFFSGNPRHFEQNRQILNNAKSRREIDGPQNETLSSLMSFCARAVVLTQESKTFDPENIDPNKLKGFEVEVTGLRGDLESEKSDWIPSSKGLESGYIEDWEGNNVNEKIKNKWLHVYDRAKKLKKEVGQYFSKNTEALAGHNLDNLGGENDLTKFAPFFDRLTKLQSETADPFNVEKNKGELPEPEEMAKKLVLLEKEVKRMEEIFHDYKKEWIS